MQSGETSMELKALHQHGWSISALAREFGLNRRTVKRELENDSPRRYPQRIKPTQLTSAQLAHIERRLAVCPTIRGTDLHAELKRSYGYAGSYPAFARHLLKLRPLLVKEPNIRFETGSGVQTQADWADLGLWPLGEQMVELHAMVAVLGCSRRPAIRMATDETRPTTFERLVRCVDDLGGATKEILTDRDPAFVIGTRHDRSAILAPEWVELCELLDIVPRTCRAYRAKTKGKVERVVKEVKESFRAWLTGQVLPRFPSLDDYDRFALRWVEEIVLPRKHRTTNRVISEAWLEEQPLLRPIPARILTSLATGMKPIPATKVIDLRQRETGEVVEIRSLADYEVAR
jgi:transposase